MLSLALGIVFFLTASAQPLARLARACAVVIPAILAASLAAQLVPGSATLAGKLLGFFAVGLCLAWLFGLRDLAALVLTVWLCFDLIGYAQLGSFPSWDQYVADGNIYAILLAALIPALTHTILRRAPRRRSGQEL